MSSERTIIAAVSPEGVIGAGGRIPWRHPGDLRRFKRLTIGATVIMGRRTWESMGCRPLPGRRNLVITRSALGPQEGSGPERAERFTTLAEAMQTCASAVWFIGGRGIYEEALAWAADAIDLTYVPDHVLDDGAVYFPPIDPDTWEPGPLLPHEDEPALTRRTFRRRVR